MTTPIGGPAKPVSISAARPAGGKALRVYRDDTLVPDGGPATPIYLVSDGELATIGDQGNPPVPIAVVTDGRPVAGNVAPIPVYVVNGVAPSPPATPSAPALTPASASMLVTWPAVAGAASYQVQRCSGTGCTGFATIATPSGATYTDSGLTPGTTYRYRIIAVNAAGSSSPSTASQAATFSPLALTPRLWLTAAGLPGSGAIATWSDSSGNGNNATQGTAAARPTVSSIGSVPAASFDGGDILNAPSVMPVGVTSAGRYTKVAIVRLSAIAGVLNNILSGTTAHAMRVIDTSGVGRLRSLNGPGGNAINAAGPNLAINTTYLLMVSWAPDLGLHSLYVNGAWVDNNVATGTAGGTTQNDTAIQIGGFNGVASLNGLLGEALLYPRLLTGAEQAQIVEWASTRYGLALSSLRLVEGIGGSWMEGRGVIGQGTTGGDTLLGQVFASLGLTPGVNITAYNDGVFGQPLSTLLTTQTAYSRYTAAASRRVCLFWVTSNDLDSGVSAATVLANVETQARRLVATGYTVLILPILPRTSGNPSYETGRGTINTGLAANAASWGATYIDIFAGGGSVLNNPSVISNPTYYQVDQIHITAAAYALISANVAPVLSGVL